MVRGLSSVTIREEKVHERLSKVHSIKEVLNMAWRVLRHTMKGNGRAVGKKTINEVESRKLFEAWFQAELKKSIEEDREILSALD